MTPKLFFFALFSACLFGISLAPIGLALSPALADDTTGAGSGGTNDPTGGGSGRTVDAADRDMSTEGDTSSGGLRSVPDVEDTGDGPDGPNDPPGGGSSITTR